LQLLQAVAPLQGSSRHIRQLVCSGRCVLWHQPQLLDHPQRHRLLWLWLTLQQADEERRRQHHPQSSGHASRILGDCVHNRPSGPPHHPVHWLCLPHRSLLHPGLWIPQDPRQVRGRLHRSLHAGPVLPELWPQHNHVHHPCRSIPDALPVHLPRHQRRQRQGRRCHL
ncbi:hypothetical protein EV177_010582, partial [Coemansia sp. RSA 1804]